MGTNHKQARVAAGAAKRRETATPARISLLVDGSLRQRIDDLAKAEKRTLNKQCQVLLERGLEATAPAA